MVFLNKKSGAKAAELRAYDSESEDDAKRRLEAAGWDMSTPHTYDETKKLFETKAVDTKEERKDAFPGNGD